MRPKPEPLLDVPPVERPAGRVLPPFQVMRAATQNTRMMHVTLRGLLAHKNWVFAAMAVAFCLSAYVYWSNPPLYSSTVSFYVLEPPVQDMDHPIYLSLRTDAVTLRHIAASTAMFDHLIDTYGLHAHYGIQDGSANDRARLYQMLQARVVVDLRESDIVAVMVKDADRAMAAMLANGIFTACDSMLRAVQQAQLNGQLRIYRHVIDSTESMTKARSSDLLRMAAELRQLRETEPAGDMHLQRSEDAELALVEAASAVIGINHELVVQHRNRSNLLLMAQDPSAGPVRLKSRATEDLGPSKLMRSVQWIITITIAVGVVAAALVLLIIETWMMPQPEAVRQRR